ncbi:MAG: hypothetical protein CMC04_04755 [Flavobacteriaceae bacterium]|nr:hypothetical protein [Flavobacteriaceae bacterium]
MYIKNRLSVSKYLSKSLKFLVIFLSLNSYVSYSQEIIDHNILYYKKYKGHNTLNIEVVNLKNNEGFIILGLFDENKKEVVTVKNIIIVDRKTNIKIDSLKSGKYVVRFWHDSNKNGKLDTNFIGIPKEEFGNSNNIQPNFGPPKFEDMIFKIENDMLLKMTAQSLNL